MSEPGYTYTTLSGRPGEPTQVAVSFCLDEDAWIKTTGLGDGGGLHLAITHGDVYVSIAPQPGQPTAEDARLARTLAEQAAIYAAEVERRASAAIAAAGAA
jgi:hypothetical protein